MYRIVQLRPIASAESRLVDIVSTEQHLNLPGPTDSSTSVITPA